MATRTIVTWLQCSRKLSTCRPVLGKKVLVHPLKDKVPIKRPPTAFSLFIKERFHDPDLKGKGIERTKELAQQWSTLTDASKQLYVDRYHQSMADFKAAHEDFWSSLSNEEAEEYREAIKTYFQRKLEYKSASEIAADCLPPSRMSGYALFIKETYNSVKYAEPKERFSLLSKRWKALSKEEKKVYSERAVKESSLRLHSYANIKKSGSAEEE